MTLRNRIINHICWSADRAAEQDVTDLFKIVTGFIWLPPVLLLGCFRELLGLGTDETIQDLDDLQ